MRQCKFVVAISFLLSSSLSFSEVGATHSHHEHGLMPTLEALAEPIHLSATDGNFVWAGRSSSDKSARLYLQKDGPQQQNWIFDAVNEYTLATPPLSESPLKGWTPHPTPFEAEPLISAIENANEHLERILRQLQLSPSDANSVSSAKVWTAFKENSDHGSNQKVWLKFEINHSRLQVVLFECDQHLASSALNPSPAPSDHPEEHTVFCHRKLRVEVREPNF